MTQSKGRPSEHVPRVGRKDAVPGRDVPRPRPVIGPSDAPLTATGPLTIPGPGEQAHRPDDGRPVLHGAGDAVIGAPLTPPPAAHSSSMSLGVDSAGGYAVPKELDGRKSKVRKRP